MSTQQNSERHITFKVGIGYFLLVGLICSAVWGVVRMTNSLTRISDAEHSVTARRQAAERLVTALLATANCEQMLFAGADNAQDDYISTIDSTEVAINVLDSLMAGRKQQQEKLDTLRILLEYRCANTLKLANSLRNDELSDVYRRHIKALRSGKDSVIVEGKAPLKEAQTERTLVIEKTGSNIFHRLAAVFRRSRTDTTLISENIEIHNKDSVQHNVNVSQSLANALAGMEEETASGHDRRKRGIATQREQLWKNNAALTTRMSHLIADFRTEESEWLKKAISEERVRRQLLAIGMGAMATGAVIVAGILFILIWRDVSKARRYSSELEAEREHTEELMVQRERLMLTVAHDIKAPAASISGYVEMLQHGDMPPQTVQYIDNIGKSSAHLLRLVTTLLDYHLLENGGIALQPVAFIPATLVRDITAGFRPQATEKGLVISADIHPSALQPVCADAFRIRQMLENLVSNALKFTSKGSVRITAETASEQLVIEVADTGTGMNVADQQRIFNAFTRLPGAQGVEGVGLGLSITRELALLLHATLDVSSEPGKGSTFRLVIPTEPLPEPEEKNDDEEGEGDEKDTAMRHLDILVIDDDRIALQLTVGMLRQVSNGQWNITAYTDAKSFWEALNRHKFDLIFTDIEMPAINGFELIKKLHQHYPDSNLPPVIALSAHGLLRTEDFRKAGFTGNLPKPFTAEQLREAVRRATNTAHATSPELPIPATAEEESTGEKSTYAFDALTVFADNDAAAACDILKQFAADTRMHAETLQTALEGHDKTEVCRIVHKMLPTFTLIESPAVLEMERLNAERGQTIWNESDTKDVKRIIEETEKVLQALKTTTIPQTT